MIFARSPQGKGRVERAAGTFQDLPGPAGHRTPAGKRGQHSGEYVRILPEHMLARLCTKNRILNSFEQILNKNRHQDGPSNTTAADNFW